MKYSVNIAEREKKQNKLKKYGLYGLIIFSCLFFTITVLTQLFDSENTKDNVKVITEQNTKTDSTLKNQTNKSSYDFEITEIRIVRKGNSLVYIKKEDKVKPYTIGDKISDKTIRRIHRDFIIIENQFGEEKRINFR